MAENPANVALSKPPNTIAAPAAPTVAAPGAPGAPDASHLEELQHTLSRVGDAMGGIARQAEEPATKALHALGRTACFAWQPARHAIVQASSKAQQSLVTKWDSLRPSLSSLHERIARMASRAGAIGAAFEPKASQGLSKAWRAVTLPLFQLWQRTQPGAMRLGRGILAAASRVYSAAVQGVSLIATLVKRKPEA